MQDVNRELKKLWERRSKEQTNGLLPLFYSTLKTNKILFVGLNPSFSERGFNAFLRGTDHDNLDVNQFYAHPNSGYFEQDKSVAIEKLAIEKYPYFKKFRAISEEVGVGWEHVDLFFIRETNQKNMASRIFEKGETLNEFGQQQIHLSKRLIEMSKPRLIVVANALASRIFKDQFSPEFDEEQGCHYVELNGVDIPVFLCSMLTGQRAMDNFSYDRLRWHIKKTIS